MRGERVCFGGGVASWLRRSASDPRLTAFRGQALLNRWPIRWRGSSCLGDREINGTEEAIVKRIVYDLLVGGVCRAQGAETIIGSEQQVL